MAVQVVVLPRVAVLLVARPVPAPPGKDMMVVPGWSLVVVPRRVAVPVVRALTIPAMPMAAMVETGRQVPLRG